MHKIALKSSLPVIITTVMFLGGCTLAPKYKKPKAPVPDKWPQGEAYEKTAVSKRVPRAWELRWEDFLTDPRLQRLIKTALENNRDLRLAALNVERARAIYGVQRAELFPSVHGVFSGSKQRVPADLSPMGKSIIEEQYSISLGIASWEIDFFGRIRSLKKQALEQYLATEEARRSVQISLVSELARVYLALAADRENLKLARSTLKTQQDMYNLIRRQYEAGLANELDLRRAQTQVETAREAAARYSQLVAQDQNALDLLAGSQVPEDLLPRDLEGVKPPRDISPGLSSEVLLRRPDIIAAEHQLKAAYAYIGAARAAFFPRISLTTALGTASDELLGLFGSGTRAWSFAPTFVMPIFDARTWAAYRVSKAQRKIALAQYERAIQGAFKEVADALAVKGTIDERLAAQKSMVEALTEMYSLSKRRYENGIDSYLSVLDAQRSLFAAQQALTSLRLAKLANLVRLYAVLGGGGGD